MRVIKRILKRLRGGEKYYMNICNDMVSDFIVSTPFASLKEAKDHRTSLEHNKSVSYVRTISFRTGPLEINRTKQVN